MSNFTPDELNLIRESGLFDSDWYLSQYPDVAILGMSAIEHFAWMGARLGRKPSPSFEYSAYLESNPEVRDSTIHPFLHYVMAQSKPSEAPLPRRLSPTVEPMQPVNALLASARRTGPKFDPGFAAKSLVVAAINQRPSHHGTLSTSAGILCQEIVAEKGAPRISVIVPTWNRADTICDAIDSILSQSISPYEVIVSDDGSSDNTVQMLRVRYRAEIQCGMLKIVENTHGGVCTTRNAGLNVSSGEVIAYLDSDNKWRRDYLLVVSAFFAENQLAESVYSGYLWHNNNTGDIKYRFRQFDRKQLVEGNFIDLNCFAHRRSLYNQFGGFDTTLSRLVDWDLIIRYTSIIEAVGLNFCGADYYLDQERLANITFTVKLENNRAIIWRKNFQERVRRGVEELRIAYFIYDYPALSQTFVFNEVRWLVSNGFDVKIYYAIEAPVPAALDFKVEAVKVASADELADRLVVDRRNIVHSHFAYPGVTQFVQPACAKAEVCYTFMPHAVDIFHHQNRERSNIGFTSSDPRCLRVFVYGDYHRKYIETLGVDPAKVAYSFQAIDTDGLSLPEKVRSAGRPLTGVVIARFIEKKGIETLIEAASRLKDLDLRFQLYGYGPLEQRYRELLAEYGLENFQFCGKFDGVDEYRRIFQTADFLIAPCVEAANGDIDGFPTVILESIAAGVPVVTTHLSAIPDYLRDGVDAFLTTPGDPIDLAAAIRRLEATPIEQLNAMTSRCRRNLDRVVGVDRTMQNLLDVWAGYKLMIFLVTYNTDKYENTTDTLAIIDRIRMHTTLAYDLVIVDNGSDPGFRASVREKIHRMPNARFVDLNQNIFCGPASNIAMQGGDAEFAIYLCSKEAFIKEHGWDRQVVTWMRERRDVALGGYTTHNPRFTLGKDLTGHPDFPKFREREYAYASPHRPFSHVQGGIYCLQREALKKYGFFSKVIPQNNMDVEYSYFLEAQGAVIDRIPGIVSLTTKTRPELYSVITEGSLAAHPLSTASVENILDAAKQKKIWRCNLCSNEHPITSETPFQPRCTNCESTSFDRAVYSEIAHHYSMYRGLSAVFLCEGEALGNACKKAFRVLHGSSAESISAKLAGIDDIGMAVIDWDLLASTERSSFATLLRSRLRANSALIGASSDGWRPAPDLPPVRERLIDVASSFLRSDWRRFASYVVK